MPHDMNGNELKVGSGVLVPCQVKGIHLTEDYCNIDIETNIAMHPSDNRTRLTLNSRQVVKKGGEVELLRAVRPFLDWLAKRGWVESPNSFTVSDPNSKVILELITKVDGVLK